MNQPIHLATEEERNIPQMTPWYKPDNLEVAWVEFEKPKAEYSEQQLKQQTLDTIINYAVDYTIYTDGSIDANQMNRGAGILSSMQTTTPIMEKSPPAGSLCWRSSTLARLQVAETCLQDLTSLYLLRLLFLLGNELFIDGPYAWVGNIYVSY